MAEINFNVNTVGSTSFAPGGGESKPELVGELGVFTENGDYTVNSPTGSVWSGVNLTVDYNIDDFYTSLYAFVNPVKGK